MFSVITITYNNLKGLQKTAKSVLSQTSENFEWLIIDGNSTDGTQSYIKELRLNTSLFVISEPDHGIYDAMNKGLSAASRDYIIFMNAGDCFADTDILKKIEKEIKNNNIPDFIYGPALEERPNSTPAMKMPRKIKSLLWGLPTHHQAMFYKAQIINDLRYNTHYKIAADYDFTYRFIQKCRDKILAVNFPICHFESGGISQKAVKTGRKEQFYIRKNMMKIPVYINIIIYLSQSMSMIIRRMSPALYWWVRGKNSAPSKKHCIYTQNH